MEKNGGRGGDGGKRLYDCTIGNAARDTWFFTIAGGLVAIPLAKKRKSYAPLFSYAIAGTVLDVMLGMTICEGEHAARLKKLQEQKFVAE